MTILDEIKSRCQAATPGPWKLGTELYSNYCVVDYRHRICEECSGEKDENKANLEFMAHAREDIPVLLKALELAVEFCADHLPGITDAEALARHFVVVAEANLEGSEP